MNKRKCHNFNDCVKINNYWDKSSNSQNASVK
jgi:hypothetical protein